MTGSPANTSEHEVESRLCMAVSGLISTIGQETFFARLSTFLKNLVLCDSIAVIYYHINYIPRVLYEELDQLDKEALYDQYFNGAYLFSPFYLKWRAADDQSALHRLQSIAPEGFFESIYYTNYYGRSGLQDEMGFIAPTDKESALLVSLGRTAKFEAYSDEEQLQLMTVEPLVSSVIKLHQRMQAPLQPDSRLTATPMQKKMAQTLEFFGASLLTEKEKHVVNLMLRGHSSKSCARELGISPTTERVHRRNIYAKLNISSQAELFTRFFDALAA